MGDHELQPVDPPRDVAPEAPLPGTWAPVDTSKLVEVKLVVASLVTLAASCGIALLNAVQASPGLLAGLPSWLQFVLIAIGPPVLAFLLGYAKPSNRV